MQPGGPAASLVPAPRFRRQTANLYGSATSLVSSPLPPGVPRRP